MWINQHIRGLTSLSTLFYVSLRTRVGKWPSFNLRRISPIGRFNLGCVLINGQRPRFAPAEISDPAPSQDYIYGQEYPTWLSDTKNVQVLVFWVQYTIYKLRHTLLVIYKPISEHRQGNIVSSTIYNHVKLL